MTTGLNEEHFEGALLPAQYNSLVRRTCHGAEAEKNLMLAVLMDAVRIYLSDRKAGTKERRIRFEETRRWFEQPAGNGADDMFAYENLCVTLGLRADRLRARLGIKPQSIRLSSERANAAAGEKKRR
jgi:hypothetical protein